MSNKTIFDKNEKHKDGTWFWHYGTFIDAKGNEYPFSVCEMSCPVGSGINAFELTWVNTIPENANDAEKKVLNDNYFKN